MSDRHGIEVISRGVCIVDGHLLLCHGRGHDNTYLPGGHIEKGESAITALKREIHEEMGVDARIGRFLGAVENQFQQKGHQVNEINLLFAMELPGVMPGDAPPVREHWLDFKWARLDTLDRANIKPGVVHKILDGLTTGIPSVGWASSYPCS